MFWYAAQASEEVTKDRDWIAIKATMVSAPQAAQ